MKKVFSLVVFFLSVLLAGSSVFADDSSSVKSVNPDRVTLQKMSVLEEKISRLENGFQKLSQLQSDTESELESLSIWIHRRG
jgi:hypothetical protein